MLLCSALPWYQEIMQASGADINVGREPIIGMPDNPMIVTGSQEQILSATVMAMAVLQELADRSNLKEDPVAAFGRPTLVLAGMTYHMVSTRGS